MKTRLYFGTSGIDGGELELLSVSMTPARMALVDVTNSGFREYFHQCSDYGLALFEIAGNSQVMVNLFLAATKVNWLIEMPNDRTFMLFEGYIETFEQSLGMSFGNSSAKIKVRIVGPVTAYYDGLTTKHAGVADISDAFSKKASQAQSKVLAAALEKVCSTESSAL